MLHNGAPSRFSSNCHIVRRIQNVQNPLRCNRGDNPEPSEGFERGRMGLNGNGANGHGLNGNGHGSQRLPGKVSIITGAGQGIGQATAVKFAQEGAKVAVCDINEATIQETVAKIEEFGGESAGFVIDVTDKHSIARMVEGVMAKWGRIDTLVNNAGIVQDAQFRKMSDDQFDRVVDVNLKGVYN